MKRAVDWKLGLWWALATIGGLFCRLGDPVCRIGRSNQQCTSIYFWADPRLHIRIWLRADAMAGPPAARFCLVDCCHVRGLGHLLDSQSRWLAWIGKRSDGQDPGGPGAWRGVWWSAGDLSMAGSAKQDSECSLVDLRQCFRLVHRRGIGRWDQGRAGK